MIDDKSLAERLFNTPDKVAQGTPTPASKPAPTPEASRAAKLYPTMASQASQKPAGEVKVEKAAEAPPATQKAGGESAAATDESFVEAFGKALGDKVDPATFASDPEVQAFAPVARELGITPEQAVKLREFQAAQTTAYWDRQSEEWAAAAKASPTFANDLIDAKTVIEKYADAEVMEFLNSPYGNHPALLAMFAKIGRSLSNPRKFR